MNSKLFDYSRLMHVEFASAIEVFYAAKLFSDEGYVQKKILDHALDEYKHSAFFRKLRPNKVNISVANGLFKQAKLDSSPLDRCEKSKFRWICYIYVGEIRAIELNQQALKIVKTSEEKKVFKEIEQDEKNHAYGAGNYLSSNYSQLRGKIGIYKVQIQYLLGKSRNNAIAHKVEDLLTGLVIKLIKRMPTKVFLLKKSLADSSLKKALKEAREIV